MIPLVFIRPSLDGTYYGMALFFFHLFFFSLLKERPLQFAKKKKPPKKLDTFKASNGRRTVFSDKTFKWHRIRYHEQWRWQWCCTRLNQEITWFSCEWKKDGHQELSTFCNLTVLFIILWWDFIQQLTLHTQVRSIDQLFSRQLRDFLWRQNAIPPNNGTFRDKF